MTNAANFNDYSGDGVFGRDQPPLPMESEENQAAKTREDTNLNNSTSGFSTYPHSHPLL
jgi:hypothetical protein